MSTCYECGRNECDCVSQVIAEAEARGYQRAIAIVQAELAKAQAERRPPSVRKASYAGTSKVPGIQLDHASRAGRITAIGSVLKRLEASVQDSHPKWGEHR